MYLCDSPSPCCERNETERELIIVEGDRLGESDGDNVIGIYMMHLLFSNSPYS